METEANDIHDLLNDSLIEKYNRTVPYYTSYPALRDWSDKFTKEDYVQALEELVLKNEPVSIYVHFPFCPKRCYYCVCHTKVTRNKEKIKEFLDYISIEIDALKEFFSDRSFKLDVKDLHLGGGSPSYMGKEEFNFFTEKIGSLVDLSNLEELAMEIDPRTVDVEKIEYYKGMGINRISLGVQDFNQEVQKIINRVQPVEVVEKLLSPEVRKGIKGINFDLIYGLPLQTRDSFRETIETAKKLSPDRITLLKYIYLPDKAGHQKLIERYDSLSFYEKIRMFVDSIKSLSNAGYKYIGINDFAKSSDDLAIAEKNKNLRRDFNGFSPKRASNLLGIGPSSTSCFLEYYFQNVYLDDYYKEVSEKKFPVLKGYRLNEDDLIRRGVINTILCEQSLNFDAAGDEYGIDFREYFRDGISCLEEFSKDRLLNVSYEGIKVTELGRIFIPQIANVFDRNYSKGEYKVLGP